MAASVRVQSVKNISTAQAARKFKKGGCFCGFISCICGALISHRPECKFRRAVACSVAIECAHGFDVCPLCDLCTCRQNGRQPFEG